MDCEICSDRPDLPAPRGDHGLLGHSLFSQLAWETGIYKDDNPDEWRELRKVTR